MDLARRPAARGCYPWRHPCPIRLTRTEQDRKQPNNSEINYHLCKGRPKQIAQKIVCYGITNCTKARSDLLKYEGCLSHNLPTSAPPNDNATCCIWPGPTCSRSRAKSSCGDLEPQRSAILKMLESVRSALISWTGGQDLRTCFVRSWGREVGSQILDEKTRSENHGDHIPSWGREGGWAGGLGRPEKYLLRFHFEASTFTNSSNLHILQNFYQTAKTESKDALLVARSTKKHQKRHTLIFVAKGADNLSNFLFFGLVVKNAQTIEKCCSGDPWPMDHHGLPTLFIFFWGWGRGIFFLRQEFFWVGGCVRPRAAPSWKKNAPWPIKNDSSIDWNFFNFWKFIVFVAKRADYVPLWSPGPEHSPGCQTKGK